MGLAQAFERRRTRRKARQHQRRLQEERLRERRDDLTTEEEIELLDIINDPDANEERRLWAMRDLGMISHREHVQALKPLIAARMEKEKSEHVV